tara:strand:+ start:185 stop:421 length:237 start_codon:yes stop_codon:yes gene_type:complete
MKKLVLASSDMKLKHVVEAIEDLENIFSVWDENVWVNFSGICAPIDTTGLDESDVKKIERMHTVLKHLGSVREKWEIA